MRFKERGVFCEVKACREPAEIHLSGLILGKAVDEWLCSKHWNKHCKEGGKK